MNIRFISESAFRVLTSNWSHFDKLLWSTVYGSFFSDTNWKFRTLWITTYKDTGELEVIVCSYFSNLD